MLIIGDVHGQYKTLMALLRKCPDEQPVAVGDMIDRGPNSKAVLQFFMAHGLAVKGNHELMMLNAIEHHKTALGANAMDVWLKCGGSATLSSFGSTFFDGQEVVDIDGDLIDWVHALPTALTVDEGKLIVTHAPVSDPEGSLTTEEMFLWNRRLPLAPPEGQNRIFGHMSNWGLCHFQFDKWGRTQRYDCKALPRSWRVACIDTSESGVLTAMHWPSGDCYHQRYVD